MRISVNAAYFETNMAVYAVDPRDAESGKRAKARELFLSRRVHVSVQVMMETYNVLIKKKLASVEVAEAYIGRLSNFPVIMVDGADARRAVDYAARYQIPHYDALHICAAERAKLPIMYSEDLSHGQTYGSVRVCNPFIEDFLG
jgi:predicted nucleic acid-binding protein